MRLAPVDRDCKQVVDADGIVIALVLAMSNDTWTVFVDDQKVVGTNRRTAKEAFAAFKKLKEV